MISALPKACTERKVEPLICLASNIRSATEISATNAVPLRSSIIRLPQAGSMIRIACGKMIRRMRVNGDILSAKDASYWPRGTDWMAPRTTSAP